MASGTARRHFRTLLAEDPVAYTEYSQRSRTANYVFAFDPWRPDFGWFPRLREVRGPAKRDTL